LVQDCNNIVSSFVLEGENEKVYKGDDEEKDIWCFSYSIE